MDKVEINYLNFPLNQHSETRFKTSRPAATQESIFTNTFHL